MTTTQMFSENYAMVLKAANLFAYRNTASILYDLYVSAGVEALIKATQTYSNEDVKFSTYAYQLVHNALINEKNRIIRHDIPEEDDYDFNKYDGDVFELGDNETANTIKALIRKSVGGNERNAKIVELHLGVDGDPIELKDLAEMFSLSHESVRLVCKKSTEKLREDPMVKITLFGKVG